MLHPCHALNCLPIVFTRSQGLSIWQWYKARSTSKYVGISFLITKKHYLDACIWWFVFKCLAISIQMIILSFLPFRLVSARKCDKGTDFAASYVIFITMLDVIFIWICVSWSIAMYYSVTIDFFNAWIQVWLWKSQM